MATLMAARRNLAEKPKALRNRGLLPLALTRRNHSTIELQAPLDEVLKALHSCDSHGRFEVDVEGEGLMRVILKQQDMDYMKQKPLHATLMEVADSDVVKMDVLVVGIGTPGPVDTGDGRLVQPTDHVKVRAKMSDMPEHLDVDVSGMQIGDSISAHEIQLPADVELLSSPDAVMFTLQVAKDAAEETAPEEVSEETTEGEGDSGDKSEES